MARPCTSRTEQLDGGPAVIQAGVRVEPEGTMRRASAVACRCWNTDLPARRALVLYCRLRYARGCAYLDGAALLASIQYDGAKDY